MANVGKSTGLEPMALGITLCDHLYQDPNTGKFSHRYSHPLADHFPCVYPMSVYACMTDVREELAFGSASRMSTKTSRRSGIIFLN